MEKFGTKHKHKRQCAVYQCRRSACKKADKPSMMRRMAIVRVAKAKKMTERKMKPTRLLVPRPRRITMDHSTSDNSEDGRRKATSVAGGKFLFCSCCSGGTCSDWPPGGDIGHDVIEAAKYRAA